MVAGAIREAVPLDPSVRLLEYGAGTGHVSQALCDTVGPITVADTSAGMRKRAEMWRRQLRWPSMLRRGAWHIELDHPPAANRCFHRQVR